MQSFSIVTCTWNSEPFLQQCIESVQSQTYPALEQLFVDGGSDDGTLQRIQALCAADGRARCLTDVRGGISRAMNAGAEQALGDVIAHLHGDDYYLRPDVLQQVADALAGSGARWAFGRIVSDIDGQQIAPAWRMQRYSRSRLLRGNFIAHPAVFMQKALFMQLGGFDLRLRFAMDYDLWLRASAVAEPLYIDLPVAAFRRHPGSASTAQADAAFLEDHAVRRRHLPQAGLRRLFHEAVHVWRRRQRGLPWRG